MEFRNILAKHSRFYDEVARLSDRITFVGANSAFIEQDRHPFFVENIWRYHRNDFPGCSLERMGVPFYFSDECEKATFLEDNIVKDMTDEQIKTVFGGSVFCTSEAAKDLIDRGYGELLGVEVREYTEGIVSGEAFDECAYKACSKQNRLMEIVPKNDGVQALSYCYRKDSDGIKLLFPAVAVFERENGKISVTYCGTPRGAFTYVEAFSFLVGFKAEKLNSILSYR